VSTRVPRKPITDVDWDAWVAEANKRGVDPVIGFDVAYRESAGFNPAQPNLGGAHYYGLNQMSQSAIEAFKLTVDDWLAMSVAEQAPYVWKFWDGKRAVVPLAFKDRGHLYAANYVPAYVRKDTDSTSYPLVTKGSPYFQENLDANRDGIITIDDLEAVLANDDRGADYDNLRTALGLAIDRARGFPTPTPQPQGPPEPVPSPTPGPPAPDPQPQPSASNAKRAWIVLLLAVAGSIAAAFWRK
jgi:hypothetical protein